MTIQLITRTVSAYFSPSQFFIADNESVTIELQDGGAPKGAPYLQVNDKLYGFVDKKLTITADELHELNACELQYRDSDGKVVKRLSTDNLHRPPISRAQDEQDVYETDKQILICLKAVREYLCELNGRIAVLEKTNAELEQKVNGKYTILNFGGKN